MMSPIDLEVGIKCQIHHLHKILFQNEAKIVYRHVFIEIKVPFKFGEDIFINSQSIKVYVKT